MAKNQLTRGKSLCFVNAISESLLKFGMILEFQKFKFKSNKKCSPKFIASVYLFLWNLSKPSFDVSSNINPTKYLLFSAGFPCKLCNESKLYIPSTIRLCVGYKCVSGKSVCQGFFSVHPFVQIQKGWFLEDWIVH